MKHFEIILLFSVFFMSSCSKEDRVLEQAVDSVRGKYRIVSMQWGGDPVDLDGDGISHKDLVTEFSVYDNAGPVFNRMVYVYPAESYWTDCTIQLEIPMQMLQYDKVTEEYSLANDFCGGSQYVFFAYAVNKDGSLSLSAQNDRIDKHLFREGDWEIDNIDYHYTTGDNILSLENGIMSVRIIGCYFDFNSSQLVTGPVDLVYERVSFAVN